MILTIIGMVVVTLLACWLTFASLMTLVASVAYPATRPLAIIASVLAVAAWSFAWWLFPYSITAVAP